VDPALAEEERFASNSLRVKHREALVAALERHTTQAPAEDWVYRLTEVGVPCGLINTIPEAFALATALGLDPVIQQTRTTGATAASAASPIGLSATPATYRLPPPTLALHTPTHQPGAEDPRDR